MPFFTSKSVRPTVAADSTAYTNFAARATALDSNHIAAYKSFLNGLTSDGFFDVTGNSTLLDALYIFATQDRTNAVLNLVSSNFNCTENNYTANFTADQGYTGGGTFWLNTQLTGNSGTHNYAQDSASQGVYNLTNIGDFNPDIGSFNGVQSVLELGGTNLKASINGGPAIDIAPPGGYSGFFAVSRTGSTTVNLYQNSSASSIGSNATASAGLDSVTISICAFNGGSGATSHQLSAAFIGAGLTGAQSALLAARINTWMTTFGINVY